MRAQPPERAAFPAHLALVSAALFLALMWVFASGCGTTTVYDYDHDEPAAARASEDGRSRRDPEATRPPRRPGGGQAFRAVEERCERHLDLVVRTGERLNVDWTVLAAIVTVESKWTPSAKNRSGASGLMQVMPSTGRRLKCGALLDPVDNVNCGAKLMRRLLDRYDDRLPYALAAYAGGARSVDRAYKAGARPPKERFVSRVLALSRAFATRGCAAVEEKR